MIYHDLFNLKGKHSSIFNLAFTDKAEFIARLDLLEEEVKLIEQSIA